MKIEDFYLDPTKQPQKSVLNFYNKTIKPVKVSYKISISKLLKTSTECLRIKQNHASCFVANVCERKTSRCSA